VRMKELVSMSINLHIFFVALTFVLAVINLLIVKNCNDYIKMTKRVELFAPLYYLSLSVVIFTGSVVLAVFKFHFKHSVYLMLLISLVIIIGAFKANRLFKMTRVKNIPSQDRYREFAYKKYLLDGVLIAVTAGISTLLN